MADALLGTSLAAAVVLTCVLAPVPVRAEGACPPAPTPLVNLTYDSRYLDGDATRSALDPEQEGRMEAALEPLEGFLRSLAGQVGAMLKAAPGDRAALADCVVAQIGVWARADALRALGTETVALTIGSRLAALALVTRAALPYAQDQQTAADVTDWLARRVREQMVFWEQAPPGAARGNLRAWAALAGAATAELADDPAMRGWATWSTAYVLCSAAPDGSLPQEMSRGRRALHYQLHAVAPLATSARLLAAQGVSLQHTCGAALDRIVAFTLGDLETGAATRAITGEAQSLFEPGEQVEDFQLAWLEAYISLTRDPRAERVAAPRRPLSFSKLGGNQTLMWAR
ncbi:MAG: alginate lyase family protein [Pseudomonadota bacterium]